MSIIKSKLDVNDATFIENKKYHLKQVKSIQEIAEKIHEGGGSKSLQLHEKRGKIFARDRIRLLLDYESPFLEIGKFAAWQVYGFESPSAGIVCGVGYIHSILCMIVANDATVKGGTYNPLTVKKHLRAQEVALQNSLPCIYLVDSGGAFLPMQNEVFPDKEHFGRIFYNQAQLSAQGIHQIAVVMGSCTAGGAYIPAMSEETIIVRGHGTIFLGGPPLVKAATGEEVSPNELGGAEVHTSESGVADYYAQSDEHALQLARQIVKNLNRKPAAPVSLDYQEPLYSANEIPGIIQKDTRSFYDAREIIVRLVDNSDLDEFKERYATTLITGFASIMGLKVGIIANNGVLFSESALKGTHFIELCCQRQIPLLFMQNITGFMVGKKYEASGIARDGAKLVSAVSNANVPKITLVTGGSYGAGNYGMCGRAFAPRFLWMWPNSRISVMGAEQAASVLYTVKQDQLERKKQKPMTETEAQAFKQPILDEYNNKSDCLYSSARLWDDGIIQPDQTRKVLAMSLVICANAPMSDFKAGIWRM